MKPRRPSAPLHGLPGSGWFLFLLLGNRHILAWPERPFAQQRCNRWHHERTNQERIEHNPYRGDDPELHQHLDWQGCQNGERSRENQASRCNN